MKVGQAAKVVAGGFTAWMVLYPVFFIAVWLLMLFGMMGTAAVQGNGEWMFAMMWVIFPLHAFTMLVSMGLLAFYFIHILKNNAATDMMRILFAIGLFFVGYVAMPIYYYAFIWLGEPPEWATGQAPTEAVS